MFTGTKRKSNPAVREKRGEAPRKRERQETARTPTGRKGRLTEFSSRFHPVARTRTKVSSSTPLGKPLRQLAISGSQNAVGSTVIQCTMPFTAQKCIAGM